jgi:hypothetical protein
VKVTLKGVCMDTACEGRQVSRCNLILRKFVHLNRVKITAPEGVCLPVNGIRFVGAVLDLLIQGSATFLLKERSYSLHDFSTLEHL